jgi:hypothetical protein
MEKLTVDTLRTLARAQGLELTDAELGSSACQAGLSSSAGGPPDFDAWCVSFPSAEWLRLHPEILVGR